MIAPVKFMVVAYPDLPQHQRQEVNSRAVQHNVKGILQQEPPL